MKLLGIISEEAPCLKAVALLLRKAHTAPGEEVWPSARTCVEAGVGGWSVRTAMVLLRRSQLLRKSRILLNCCNYRLEVTAAAEHNGG